MPTAAAARDVDVSVVSDVVGVVDGVKDVEENTRDTFSSPVKTLCGGSMRMERRWHWAARPTSTKGCPIMSWR
jgi:hypothetical protein